MPFSNSLTPIGDLKLAVLSVLVGGVTTSLRGVCVAFVKGEITGRFIFEDPVSPEYTEFVDLAETEVIAHFGGLTPVRFSTEFQTESESLQLAEHEQWVFLRRE
jgi:hypothetical protein